MSGLAVSRTGSRSDDPWWQRWGVGRKVGAGSAVGCAAQEEEDKFEFCNLDDGAKVVMPIIPLCTSVTGEASDYSSVTVETKVNGKEIKDESNYTFCAEYFTWIDIPLNEGQNIVSVTKTYDGEASETQEIEITYAPGYSTAQNNLLYAMHNGRPVVIDVDKKALLGKIETGAERDAYTSHHPMLLSPDSSKLYILRANNIEVIDTSSQKRMFEIKPLDNAEMFALSPDGAHLFILAAKNGQPLIMIFNALTGEKISEFVANCSDCGGIAVDENKNVYILSEYQGVAVYYSSFAYKKSKNILAYQARAFKSDPAGKRIVVSGNELTVIDAKTSEILFTMGNVNAGSIVFSSDGKTVYLGGDNELTAIDLEKKTLSWQKEWDGYVPSDAEGVLAISQDGKKLYRMIPDQCGTTIEVIKATDGKTIDVIPQVPADKNQLLFKPALPTTGEK